MAGRLDAALESFDFAIAAWDGRPSWWQSDRAAALVERAEVRGDPYDLLLALEALAAADQKLPEVAYNRALVLERLYLLAEAAKAWRSYLEVDPDSPWAAEARDHLSRIQAKLRVVDGFNGRTLAVAAAAGRTEEVRAIVVRSRQESRDFAQEGLLAQWGEAVLRQDAATADAGLRAAREIGQALSEAGGEYSLADAVAAIDRVVPRSRSRLEGLARAHVAYARGVALRLEQRLTEAAPSFREASLLFSQADSPARHWADFYLALTLYYSADSNRAAEQFQEISGRAIERYPALVGRCLWARGLIALRSGESRQALGWFDQAGRAFAALQEGENLGAVRYLRAEALEHLEQPRVVWRARLAAAETLAPYRRSKNLSNFLVEAANALQESGYLAAATFFQSEQITVARRLRNPYFATATALILREKLYAQMGLQAAADRDFAAILEQIEKVGDPELQRRLEADALTARYQFDLDRAPEQAIAALSQAISTYQESHPRLGTLARLLRARAYLATHETALAEADLRAGIAVYEAALSAGRMDGVWEEIADQMVRLQLVERRSAAAGFQYAERSRQPGFPEKQLPATDFVSRMQAELPPGVAAIEYAVLPDRVAIWVLRRDGFYSREVAVAQSDLEALVERFLGAVHQPLSPAFRDASEQLFELIVRPVLGHIGARDRLVIVPDRCLTRLPLAALIDGRTGRYWVEDHVLEEAPGLLPVARRAREDGGRSVGKWLVVGEPDLGPWSPLPDLPEAENEAREIAGQYAGSARLLVGKEATREAVLALLPYSGAMHFSGHARADAERPGKSYLYLAAGPDQQATRLTAEEIERQPLQHVRLVILSACEGAPGSRFRGEGIAGVGAAFLNAGVGAILGTIWRIDDEPSRRSMIEYHRLLRGGADPATALARLQRSLLRSTDPERRRPAHWAAFRLVGIGSFDPPAM
ncbi:MAG TPA: CHAT domain-containing protein [Thermoanaerobaculia bacterium]|nr:CHAT domain-containing protein [Thermoanaerobaculia bacterium]